MRRIVWSVLGLLGLVFVLGLGVLAWWWFGSAPSHSGKQVLSGLSAPVQIEWDPRGVPTLKGACFEDLLEAQGFLHGYLRPFQVEMRRRAVSGQLAEIGGPGLLAQDREALEAGYLREAQRDIGSLSAGPRRRLEAYLKGLNSGLEAACRRLPPAFRIAGLRPKPWGIIEALAFGRLFSSDLSDASASEKERLELVLAFGEDEGKTLWAVAHGEPFPPVPDEVSSLMATVSGKKSELGSKNWMTAADSDFRNGSNAWAVSPRKTARGAALLAGDPHLGFVDFPGVWFEQRLEWPGGRLAGVSLPGVPGVLIGHNEQLAWSFTVAGFDESDLFLVEVDQPKAPTRYKEGGSWLPFKLEKQTVKIRKAAPQELIVRWAGAAVYKGPSGIPGYGLLERSAPREGGTLLENFNRLMDAHSVSEGVDAVRDYQGCGMNFIAIDRDGHIAQAVVGLYPNRVGKNWDGRFPDIWRGPGSWQGTVPGNQMPLIVDPPAGFVASANEAGLSVAPPVQGAKKLTGDFADPYRADRIKELLQEDRPFDLDAMAKIQLDTRSGRALLVQEAFRSCRVKGPAAEILLDWNGRMEGAGGSLLFAIFRSELARRMRQSTRLGKTGAGGYFQRTEATLNLIAAAKDNVWIAEQLDDPATAWVEDPCSLLQKSAESALLTLSSRLGADPKNWGYEVFHRLRPHSLVAVGILDRWMDPRGIGVPGAADSVNALGYRAFAAPWNGQPFFVNHGPSYRLLATFDPAGKIVSRSAIPQGTDEHPRGAFFFSRLERFAAGQTDPLSQAEPGTEPPLVLEPR